MSRQALRIEVKPVDKVELLKLLRGGVQPVRTVVRALVLLQLASGPQRAASLQRLSPDPASSSEGGPSLPRGRLGTRTLRISSGLERLACWRRARDIELSP